MCSIMTTLSNHKKTIENNFSKRAHLYDEYANIQYLTACELIEGLPPNGVINILEIGCGTGNYTRLLKKKFNNAHIKALDKSRNVVEIAKKKLKNEDIEFVVADAEKSSLGGGFDLITSNAALQWFADLERWIEKCKNALTEKGVISFSTFGPLTFRELGYSLKEAMGKDLAIPAANFLCLDEIAAILARHFKERAVREHIIKEKFSSLAELLNKIRCTGARGGALDNIFLWKRNIFERAEGIYRQRFGKIEATYQIFFCKALL